MFVFDFVTVPASLSVAWHTSTITDQLVCSHFLLQVGVTRDPRYCFVLLAFFACLLNLVHLSTLAAVAVVCDVSIRMIGANPLTALLGAVEVVVVVVVVLAPFAAVCCC